MATKDRSASPSPQQEPGSVPFISTWHGAESFSDIPANVAVTDARRMLEGWTATRKAARAGLTLEAEVGEWNTVQAGLLDLLARSRRAVARIVVPGGLTNWAGIRSDIGWTGTGFLVAPNLLITNHHVLNDPAVAAVATAEFDFELPGDKLLAGDQVSEPPTVRFGLTPTRLFLTSPVTDGGLDYTFVWITEKAAERFGTIRMERGSFMIGQNEPVFVIHHPKGRLKEVSLDDTEVLGVNSVNILYAADTDYGSSGACVFNRNGRLVALHHARQSGENLRSNFPDAATRLTDGRPVTVGNEGVKISAIAIDLETKMRGGGPDAESAREVMGRIEGSDTLTGIFGAIGRHSAETRESDRVRDVYLGSAQDVDIGLWNMHWLHTETGSPVRAHDAVTAMIDLNQDVWCLTDVPPASVAGIVKGMRERFSEEVEVAFAEPDAERLQLATALIWRPGMVSCTRLTWPEEIAGVFTRPVPTPDHPGPLFPATPALFRIGPSVGDDPAAGADWQVNVVPLSLQRIRSDETRRRLVSKLMVRVIGLAIDQGGTPGDWIIGGDVDPALASTDTKALTGRGYAAMAATDTRRGSSVNYLRAPASGIRTAFVTSDLKVVTNYDGFFEVIENRTVDRFISKLADNRPAVLRLVRKAGRASASDETLDATINAAFDAARASGPGFQSTGTSGQPWSAGLTWRGLDARGFLEANRTALARLVAEIARRGVAGSPDQSPLTESDLWVLTFTETNLGPQGVDPGFRHSNGEIGLYPLPDNITFWIGADAPRWDQPMPIETNIENYARYLNEVRNKPVATVGERTLYRDLFRTPGIAGHAERQSCLLAGIVQGCFLSSNYQGRPVPFDRILQGYAADAPIDRILSGTGYIHADTPILTERQRRIDSALAAWRGFGQART